MWDSWTVSVQLGHGQPANQPESSSHCEKSWTDTSRCYAFELKPRRVLLCRNGSHLCCKLRPPSGWGTCSTAQGWFQPADSQSRSQSAVYRIHNRITAWSGSYTRCCCQSQNSRAESVSPWQQPKHMIGSPQALRNRVHHCEEHWETYWKSWNHVNHVLRGISRVICAVSDLSCRENVVLLEATKEKAMEADRLFRRGCLQYLEDLGLRMITLSSLSEGSSSSMAGFHHVCSSYLPMT